MKPLLTAFGKSILFTTAIAIAAIVFIGVAILVGHCPWVIVPIAICLFIAAFTVLFYEPPTR